MLKGRVTLEIFQFVIGRSFDFSTFSIALQHDTFACNGLGKCFRLLIGLNLKCGVVRILYRNTVSMPNWRSYFRNRAIASATRSTAIISSPSILLLSINIIWRSRQLPKPIINIIINMRITYWYIILN